MARRCVWECSVSTAASTQALRSSTGRWWKGQAGCSKGNTCHEPRAQAKAVDNARLDRCPAFGHPRSTSVRSGEAPQLLLAGLEEAMPRRGHTERRMQTPPSCCTLPTKGPTNPAKALNPRTARVAQATQERCGVYPWRH